MLIAIFALMNAQTHIVAGENSFVRFHVRPTLCHKGDNWSGVCVHSCAYVYMRELSEIQAHNAHLSNNVIDTLRFGVLFQIKFNDRAIASLLVLARSPTHRKLSLIL